MGKKTNYSTRDDMHRELIDRLLAEVPILHMCRIADEKLPNGVWFIIEVRPLPPIEQIQMVIEDLQNDTGVFLLKNGTVTHSRECNQRHKPNEDILPVEKVIEPQTFRIAVWEGNDFILNGQPVVISLEPEISYNIYPDHPHINTDFRLPDSICYTDNPKMLGNDPYTRVLEAIQQTCIWLFKHQVWLASKKIGKEIWIGPVINAKDDEQFYYLRNPNGKCRCGKNKLYNKCHLNLDFKCACGKETIFTPPEIRFSRFKNDDGSINLASYNQWWKNYNFIKQSSLDKLKEKLMS